MNNRRIGFAWGVLAVLASACDDGPPAPVPTPEQVAYCQGDAAEVEQRIATLLRRMTLEEKAAQMHGIDRLPADGTWRTSDAPRLEVPGLAMVEGPRGLGKASGNGTAFPVGMARGATWNPDLERQVGQAVGREARSAGGSVVTAPTINILRHPRWGRAQETYGEDPWHVGRMAVAFIGGVQEQQVIASVKHFAANTIEKTRFDVDVSMDERTLREIYLPHFRAAVQEAHVGSVMSAYNSVNGSYCGENGHLLGDILKGEWGFAGFVESDWYFGTHDTLASAEAGLDIEMPVDRLYGLPIVNAVRDGTLDIAVVDQAVSRILRAKLCFAVDTNPPQVDLTQRETPEHLALALEVAREATVLLKNQGNLLPIDRTTGPKIVVLGPLADLDNIGDRGSSDVAPTEVITAVEGLQQLAGAATVTYLPGDVSAVADQAAVSGADYVVLVVGATSSDEGEGLLGAGDRRSLELAASQQQLIAAAAALNDNIIVVLEGGAAFTMEGWVDQADALLMAWYPGARGGTAIAELLFGEVNPSGRLPISFARAEGDYPPFDNVSTEVTYGYYHGYRLLDQRGTAPLFPFGFGLGYTTFAYSDLPLAPASIGPDGTVTASVTVTNTGTAAGTETVQLYVSYPGSAVDRVVRELKGFGRVTLAPGESSVVSIPVRAADLAYYDTTSAQWVVEAQTYEVAVGHDSRDLPLTASFQVH